MSARSATSAEQKVSKVRALCMLYVLTIHQTFENLCLRAVRPVELHLV